MKKLRQSVMILLLVALMAGLCVAGSYDTVDVTTETLDNGCALTRKVENATLPRPRWYEMPLPHLNCSGAGITQFNIENPGIDDVKSITLSYNDLIQLHVEDLKGFTSLVKIEVKSSKLQRVVASSQGLILTSVTYLSLTHNQLTSVPNAAMKSFPNLKILLLYSNSISTINDDDFIFNKRLQRLYLGPNPLNTFADGWMTRLNLTKLDLRGSALTSIPSHVASLIDLEYADFSDNKITYLRSNIFRGCKELRWLDLTSNYITNIHPDAFNGTGNLQVVDLSDNLLETLVPGTFDGTSEENLQIDLYENPFNCNCSMAWFKSWTDFMKSRDMSTEIRYKCEQPARNHGKKSKQLTLDDFTCDAGDVTWQDCFPSTPSPVNATSANQTRTCPRLCVCYDENKQRYWPPPGSDPSNQDIGWSRWNKRAYPSVECISVGLTTIPDDIPADAKMITLTGNKITAINLMQFRKFANLTTLDLKKNGIRTIIPDATLVLPEVSSLNLRFNSLMYLHKDVLRSFPNLTALALFHNQMREIPSDLFVNNRKLSKIFVGPNPVKLFEENFMMNLDLTIVSLRNLSIKAVPATLGGLVNMSYCDLSDNLITVIKNRTFSRCIKLEKLILEHNHITTIEANAFNGAVWLRNLKLSENMITMLPAAVFSNVSQDRLTVELWENPFTCDCNLKALKAWIDFRQAFDTTTDIRFRCDQPLRMHNKLSDQLTTDDFVCNENDARYSPDYTCTNPTGRIAMAAIVTLVSTLLCCAIAWRCTHKRRYSKLLHYAKQRDEFIDAEEL